MWKSVSSSSEVEWSSVRRGAESGEGVRRCNGEGGIVLGSTGACELELESVETIGLGAWLLMELMA